MLIVSHQEKVQLDIEVFESKGDAVRFEPLFDEGECELGKESGI